MYKRITSILLLLIFVILFCSSIPVANTPRKESTFNFTILVNQDYRIPSDYQGKLINYEGHSISSYIKEDLIRMMKNAQEEDITLVINNAYRSAIEQEAIFQSTVTDYMNQGYTYQQAYEKTKLTVSLPYYSEHETGLAIDFSTGNYHTNEKMWNWLKRNAYQYGFILRYPKDKTQKTKISFEPWHYRYVGPSIAKQIYENNWCLEEYIDARSQKR